MSHLGTEHDAAIDYNGDGRTDVLWLQYRNGNPVFVQWLAEPNGSFAENPAAQIAFPSNSRVVGMADFNGDGHDDLLWAQGATLREWLAQGDGSFAENPAAVYETHLSSGSTSFNPYEHWFIGGCGDFNGDGRDDILWTDGAHSVSEWLGQSDGTFAWNPAAMYVTPSDWQVMGVGDFNGDGRDDVRWGDDFNTQGQWLGQADGTFAYNPAGITQGLGGMIGDVNGDGRDDIIHYQVYDVVVWLTLPNGGVSDSPAVSYEIPHDWQLLGSGDFDGDGRADLLWRDQFGVMGQWDGQPDGSFDWNRDAIYQVDGTAFTEFMLGP